MLDYSGIATKVQGLGPGERVVLWVRGCNIGCPGCMTTDLWASGHARPIEPLAQELIGHLAHADGLTISGGEPFQQAPALTKLVRLIRAQVELNIICYSGFTWERLKRSEETRVLLECLDVLMDGPYRKEESNTKQWRGSDNQRAIVLTERGKALGDFDAPNPEHRRLQLQPLSDGSIRIIGIPKRKDMDQLKALVQERGLTVREAE